MKKTLFTMVTAGLIAAASAQDAATEAGAKIEGDAAEDAVKAQDLNALLKDQLIKIDGDEAKSAELEQGMEYYLVYHSASW